MAKFILVRMGLVLLGVVVAMVGWVFVFYKGFPQPAPVEMPTYREVVIPPAPTSPFTDNYTSGKGIVLLDLAHNNDFDKEELNVLWLRLVARGLTIKFFKTGDDLKKELLGKAEEEKPKGEQTEEKPKEELQPSDAFIVVSPRTEFSKEDSKTIEEFVKNGGKLLLIADPTRNSEMNSLSLKFGLIFEADYLYNMKENEINYRNIFVTDFKENSITKNLKKIALYTVGSISSPDSGIVFTDNNTFSSVVETRKKLAPIALAREAKILAIYDLTFLTEPYNGILDNNQLIANIADWLMPATKRVEAK